MAPDLVIGIDTGGTYTDGVLLENETREVISKVKTLTTRQDLSLCILTALDALLPEDRTQIKLFSISTTLATNAIAEGKSRPAALYLLGYDQDLVSKFRFGERFATSEYFFFTGGHTFEGNEQVPLDTQAIAERTKDVRDKVEAIAVSGYFSPYNSAHEEQALELIQEHCDLPVVLGHQLYSRLDSITRATTASLNASLLSILQDFIRSMLEAMEERYIRVPLMIVRGDGGLMSESVAQRKPVETIHSGPAASAIGAKFLSKVEHALVVDIGGTTTDLALLEGGRVAISERGTNVGPFSTGVRAAKVRSIGLGGDSLIGLDSEDQLVIGPSRVVPLAYLAHIEPSVSKKLKRMQDRGLKRLSAEVMEFWFLVKEPVGNFRNERAAQVFDMLRDGPISLPEILSRMEVYHPLQFNGPDLINQEIVGRAGLTPTDLMHISGDYTPWDVEASKAASSIMATLRGQTLEAFNQAVRDYIHESLVRELITFLSEQSLDWQPGSGRVESLGQWLFAEHLFGKSQYLGNRLSLKVPIIGLGAPANVFLPRLAESFNTALILPTHYEVANAIGAIVANVMVIREARVTPLLQDVQLSGYAVQCGKVREGFADLESALEYAKSVAKEAALRAAFDAGAKDPVLEIEELAYGFDGYCIRARAVGNPDLGRVKS